MVFTLPEQIAVIAYQNKEVVYRILFRAAAPTLRTIAAAPQRLGAESGFFAGAPHLGPEPAPSAPPARRGEGGGLSPDGSRWISCRPRFFLPVRVLRRLFRRLFLKYLEKAFATGKRKFCSSLESLRDRGAFLRHLAPVRKLEWNVYAKAPFAGPQQALD